MPDIIQRSFTSGEISPAVGARADLTKYSTGLSKCENFFIRAQGGVYSRPGTRYVGEQKSSAARGRLIPFQFNTEQSYILLFENNVIRFIKDGGYIESSPGVPYELATTYTTAQLSRLNFVQNADILTIVHPDHDPKELGRVTDTNWTLTTVSYASTVTAPGALTLTAVGTGAGTYNKRYRYVVTTVDADGIESVASPANSINTPSLSQTAGVQIDWADVAGADYYRVYKENTSNATASGIYGWIGDTKVSIFDDYNIAPIMSDAPPENRTPFTGTDNKPSTVTYYQQRLIFANTNNEPQTIYTTQTANYQSLRTSNPPRDTDAVTFTIAARQVNEVRHILPLDSMIILTSGGEWKTTEGQEEVLAPATIGIRIQSYNGCSWTRPVVVNSTAIFVQEKGAKLRDLNYEFTSDKYTGNDLSIMAEHLFEGYQIEEMAYSAEPYGIIWCIRDDGTLLGLTYQKEHQVWGWHQHTTQGTFESVASITEDDRDAVYVIVNRTINGATKRYIERLEPRYDDAAENAFCVDCGLSYDGSPATSISGLGHLEGEDVAVLADGNEVTGLTVSSGAITLPNAASIVHVGLSYTPVIETLEIDIPSQQESLKNKEMSVSQVVLDVYKSRGGWVGPRLDKNNTGTMYEIKPRFDSDSYDTIALRSFKEEIYVDPAWGNHGGIRIEQRAPLPLAILAILPTIDVSS